MTDVDNKGEREFLSFGTNVDISDETIWHHQLQELNKLPTFLRVRDGNTVLNEPNCALCVCVCVGERDECVCVCVCV